MELRTDPPAQTTAQGFVGLSTNTKDNVSQNFPFPKLQPIISQMGAMMRQGDNEDKRETARAEHMQETLQQLECEVDMALIRNPFLTQYEMADLQDQQDELVAKIIREQHEEREREKEQGTLLEVNTSELTAMELLKVKTISTYNTMAKIDSPDFELGPCLQPPRVELVLHWNPMHNIWSNIKYHCDRLVYHKMYVPMYLAMCYLVYFFTHMAHEAKPSERLRRDMEHRFV